MTSCRVWDCIEHDECRKERLHELVAILDGLDEAYETIISQPRRARIKESLDVLRRMIEESK